MLGGMCLIGDIIRKLRDAHDIKQQDFAKILNVGKSTLSQYENNVRTPSDEVKKLIADYFSVSIDYLLGMTTIPDKIDDYITKKNIHSDRFDVTEEEKMLLSKFRKLPERQKIQIETRIDVAYENVLEEKKSKLDEREIS